MKPAGRYRHGDLANALLDAAGALVASRGAPDFSLREVAERTGVRHAALYRHYDSKEALIAALAARAFERMRARFDAVLAEETDSEARIAALGACYLEIATSEPGAYRVMFARDVTIASDRMEAAKRTFDSLVEVFADGQRAGVVRKDIDAIALAATVWSGLHGLAMLILDGRLREGGAAGGPKLLFGALNSLLRDGWRERG